MWCSGHVLLGRPKKSCMDVARQREVWLSLLRLPSYNTDSHKQQKMLDRSVEKTKREKKRAQRYWPISPRRMETEHERRDLSVLNSHQKLRSAQCVLCILCFSVALLSTFLNLIAVTSKCGWRSTVLETKSKDYTFQPTTATRKLLLVMV